MQGKYHSRVTYAAVRGRRAALRAVLRHRVRWRPIQNPTTGYCVIIGCHSQLTPMLMANLTMLARQDLTDLREIILVFDRPAQWMPERIEQQMNQAFPELPLRCVYYSPWQTRVARIIGWAWVYSWLSRSLGIAAVDTRYAMLHDFDAMLIERELLHRRYQAIVVRGDHYVGEQFYEGNGVLRQDQLAKTYELMFDAAFVRERFRPIDLFNHVAIKDGRSIDYDTFLWAQDQAGSASVLPIEEEDMVHPSQMICQFTQLQLRGEQPRPQNNLVLIPYFWYLGGRGDLLSEQTQHLRIAGDGFIPFFGRRLEVSTLTQEGVQWVRKQAYRLERALVGDVRHEVAAYFEALEHIVQPGPLS